MVVFSDLALGVGGIGDIRVHPLGRAGVPLTDLLHLVPDVGVQEPWKFFHPGFQVPAFPRVAHGCVAIADMQSLGLGDHPLGHAVAA